MRLKYISIVISSALLLNFTSTGWAGDRYCRALINSILPNTLYSVHCAHEAKCVSRVVYSTNGAVLERADGTTSYLRRGRHYHFIYKVLPTFAQNSLVVVHIKRLDNPSRDKSSPARVKLQRKSIQFGCRGFSKHVKLRSWPPSAISERYLPSVGYDKYDHFHRYGYTSGDEDRVLRNKFHVRYNNGNGCVSTLDAERRWQFLFEDRTNVPGVIAAFLARLNLYASSANAAALEQVRKFAKLKVLVTNYASEKDRNGAIAPACFGFAISTGGSRTVRVDVSVSDVESVAPLFPFDATKDWSFNVQ